MELTKLHLIALAILGIGAYAYYSKMDDNSVPDTVPDDSNTDPATPTTYNLGIGFVPGTAIKVTIGGQAQWLTDVLQTNVAEGTSVTVSMRAISTGQTITGWQLNNGLIYTNPFTLTIDQNTMLWPVMKDIPVTAGPSIPAVR